MKNIENEVNDYVSEFRKMIENDQESLQDLFDNEYADADFFWEMFKQQSLLNMIERDSPELTTTEFKEVHRKMFLKSIIETMEELKEKGLVTGNDIEGYQLTNTGKRVVGKIP